MARRAALAALAAAAAFAAALPLASSLAPAAVTMTTTPPGAGRQPSVASPAGSELPQAPAGRETMSRRHALSGLAAMLPLAANAVIDDFDVPASGAAGIIPGMSLPQLPTLSFGSAENRPRNIRSTAYEIVERNPPMMQPLTARGEGRIQKLLATQADALFLGHHPNSETDQALAAELLQKFAQARKGTISVGLEAVPQSLQPALDAFMRAPKSSTTEAERVLLKEAAAASAATAAAASGAEGETEGGAGGGGSGGGGGGGINMAAYLPVLRVAKSLQGFSVVALGVGASVVGRVREGGLESLSDAERSTFVGDANEFVESVTAPGFKFYSDKVIQGVYEKYMAEGALGPSVTPANFFAAQILTDEAMAKRSVEHMRGHPDDLMVVLSDIDRCTYGLGAPGRLERVGGARLNRESFKVKTMLLNPTARDSLSPIKSLRLNIGVGANQAKVTRPVGNYVWFSKSPPPNLLIRYLDPIS